MLRLSLLALFFVHLCGIVGILSLYNVAETIFYILFSFAYLIGIYLDIKNYYPVRRVFLNLSAILLSLYLLSFISLEDLLRPFANVVLLLLAIKSLEEKKVRDLYQILLLSLFAVSISTAYNLSISFAFILLLEVALGVLSLVFINLYRSAGDSLINREVFKSYAYTSLLFFLMVALFTVPFFVLLPRTQTPLFDFFGVSKGGLKTGIADSVSLGKVGEIQQDNTVVFRAYGLPKGLKDVYWRVSVFDTYTGREWINTNKKQTKPPIPKGKLVSYAIFLEPTFERYMPALDHPVAVSNIQGLQGSYSVLEGGVFEFSKEITRAIRYTAVSSEVVKYQDNPNNYLQIPKNIGKGVLELANELSKGANTEEEKIERVKKYFSKDFKYSLKLDAYQGDPLEYFLLVSKKGNCEYYASATAVLLRLMNVPARVVGGFKGGVWNEIGNYYVITNSMAHVWVEAYVKGAWIRIDTTPPYTSPALSKVSKLSLFIDAIVSFWYSNVIGFSSEKQFQLFKRLQKDVKLNLKPEKIRGLIYELLRPLMLLLLIYASIRFYMYNRKTPENLYRKLVHTLKIKEKVLPEEVLRRFKDAEIHPYIHYIVSLYQRYKYSPYKVYRDEIYEGYRALAKVKELLKSNRNYHHS